MVTYRSYLKQLNIAEHYVYVADPIVQGFDRPTQRVSGSGSWYTASMHRLMSVVVFQKATRLDLRWRLRRKTRVGMRSITSSCKLPTCLSLQMLGSEELTHCLYVQGYQCGYVPESHGPGSEVAPHAQDRRSHTHHGQRNFFHPASSVNRYSFLQRRISMVKESVTLP